MDYLELFFNAFLGTVKWTWRSIIFDVPRHRNYFWGLIAISILVFALEIVFPWRKNKKFFEKTFGWMVFICFSTFSFLAFL